jgi:hypothetical protein
MPARYFVHGVAGIRARSTGSLPAFMMNCAAWRGVAGDAKSKTAYKEFLDLWKGANSGIPILRHSKMEYSKL